MKIGNNFFYSSEPCQMWNRALACLWFNNIFKSVNLTSPRLTLPRFAWPIYFYWREVKDAVGWTVNHNHLRSIRTWFILHTTVGGKKNKCNWKKFANPPRLSERSTPIRAGEREREREKSSPRRPQIDNISLRGRAGMEVRNSLPKWRQSDQNRYAAASNGNLEVDSSKWKHSE